MSKSRKKKPTYEQPSWAVQQIQRASGLIEDVCNCGVGHPNVAWMKKHGSDGERGLGVHGCCGCCSGKKNDENPPREEKKYSPDICISCKQQVDSQEYWPLDALVFEATGNYGSSIFDPMTGHRRLRVVICDDCVVANADHVKIVEEVRPPEYETREFKIDECRNR